MNLYVAGAAIFIVSVTLIELLFFLMKAYRNTNKKRINRRLKALSTALHKSPPTDILRQKKLSDVPLLNKIFLQIPGIQQLEQLLLKSNSRYPLGVFILLSFLVGIVCFVAIHLFTRNLVTSFLFSVIIFFIPYFYLIIKKKKRMEKFERQLPEGMELIARALKAGHAFTSGMRMAADEFDDPLGPELDYTLDELNFGISMQDALNRMTTRVDCMDLKYFVVSVVLQRETGGNLAEIIETSSRIIRERFKFQGLVKTLAAEAKLSAIVLDCVPFALVGILYVNSPKYIQTLFTAPEGRICMYVAGVMMIIGNIVMKKMVEIKV